MLSTMSFRSVTPIDQETILVLLFNCECRNYKRSLFNLVRLKEILRTQLSIAIRISSLEVHVSSFSTLREESISLALCFEGSQSAIRLTGECRLHDYINANEIHVSCSLKRWRKKVECISSSFRVFDLEFNTSPVKVRCGARVKTSGI